MKSRIFFATLAIILLAVGVWYAVKERKPAQSARPATKQGAKTRTSATPQPRATITDVDSAKLPERFPAELPIEAGATITLNYNAVNTKGLFQATREFVSAKSMADNFALYQAALKEKRWSIAQAVDDTQRQQKLLLASKGGNQLNIRIYTDGGKVKVSISNETQP